ncbi:MAG: DUF488 domain-containing protein [Chloroflexi bacterium]|nr:DUF488 domain-containing protein [Chloroflexota bacterium]
MPTLCTIGYQRKSLETFIGLLRKASVDVVIDVRLRNTSHLAGYTKRDDLAFLLREGFDIAYEYHPELAPTPEIFDAYRENQDWSAYVSSFLPLLTERDAPAVGHEITAHYCAPCLLCAEPTADHCHRRLVAEHWARYLPGLTIMHL